jgi:ATP adenylyltransferase
VSQDEPVERVGEEGRDARHDQPGVGVEDLQRMWAPWRFGYIAGGEALEGCPFCVLPARDPAQDATSLILHRGQHSYVIFNAYPYNPGHLMVVPYGHVADLESSRKRPQPSCGSSVGAPSGSSSSACVHRVSTSA